MSNALLFGQKISLGSEFGVVSSINTKYNIADFEHRRNTYYSGLNLNYNFNDRLSFTSGFHYLRQGYRHPTCYILEEGEKNELVGKIDYLSIPITANIDFHKSRKLIATFGILGSYNIKAVQDYPEPIGGCEIYYFPDLSNWTRDFMYSGIIGLGYKILENDKFELISSVKYYQALTNSFKNPNTEIHLDIDKKYSSALMSINFNYKL